MNVLGELAALTTAVCWAFTSIFFTEAGRRIGSFRVNKIRLLMAVTIYTIVIVLTTGRLFSAQLTWTHVFYLGISGLFGLVLGDSAGFKAMVMIGPRLSSVVFASAPVMATIIAWIFLGEILHPVDLLGITITVGGIAWVVLERRFSQSNNLAAGHPDAGSKAKGVFMALIAAFGQAAGLILAKFGMLRVGAEIAPMDASYIRMLVALAAIWIISAARRNLRPTIVAMKDRKAMTFALGGAFFGPFLGVWMSLVAVRIIPAGIAATLNAMTPILLIPAVMVIYKEKVSARAILGAIVAVLGVAILMLT
jgi:drug/metabolite transporter (DMT)-like permease